MDIYEEDVAVEESPIPQFGGHYDERAPQLNAYQPWDHRAPQLNQNPDVDWDYVNKTVAPYLRMQQYQDQKKFRDAKIREQAIRFAGQQEMDSLIKAGTTPMEAFRRTAGKIHYNDPEGYASSMMRLREPVKPSMENIDGISFIKYGDGRYSPAPKPPKPEPDQSKIIDEYLAKKEHTEALRELSSAKKPIKGKGGKMEENHEAIANAARRARLAEGNLKALAKPPTITETVEEILELPKAKDELSKGAKYKTSKGTLTWDGEKFVR